MLAAPLAHYGVFTSLIANSQTTSFMIEEALDRFGNPLSKKNPPAQTKDFEAVFGEISRDARLPKKYVELALSKKFYRKYSDNYMDDVLENPSIPSELFSLFLGKEFANGEPVAAMLMKVAVHPNCPIEISATLIKRIMEGQVIDHDYVFTEKRILQRINEELFDKELLNFGFEAATLESMPLLMKMQTLSSWGF